MATVRLFAAIREAAGTSTLEVEAQSVDAVLAALVARFGDPVRRLLPSCSVMLDGEIVRDRSMAVRRDSEVALLPPVSGGAS